MEIVKQIIIMIITISIASLLLWTVFDGIKHGKIHHTDSIETCSREKKPLMFWSLVIYLHYFLL